VHRTDWRSLDLGWLVPPGTTPGLDAQLDYYRRFLDWTAQGRPQPTAEAVWKWLVANQPAESGDVTLCWGDARLGNIIWQDFDAAAVIDWEMATLAQPELDLGWWLYFDRQFTEGLGVERPSGFRAMRPPSSAMASCSGATSAICSGTRSSAGSASLSSCAASRTCWSARACCRASRTWGPQPRHPVPRSAARPALAGRGRLRAGRTTSVGPVRAGSVRRGDGDARVAEALGEPLGAVGLLHGLEPPA